MQDNDMEKSFDILKILEYLPHRYPFLLVDRILEVEPGKRIVGMKNVTFNEPHFQGHFPGEPIMPGVLQIEAMAQTGAVLLLSLPENRGKIAYLAGVESARFKRPIVPGDQLVIESTMQRYRRGVGKAHNTISIDGEVVAEAVIQFAVPQG
jgi:3-hydroxyacyl-[acyl-carrier-protein] dehydratase